MVVRCIVIAIVVAVTMGCSQTSDEGGPEVSNQPLADELAGWRADGEVSAYDTESIFAYIDGHAEVFLAYGMQGCTSRRYVEMAGEGELVVDLFEMPSAADAFGVFSHDRSGEEVDVGQGAVYRLGWLSFWKGSWYGSIYAAEDTPREGIIALGAAVADGLIATGDPPTLPQQLPPTGLDAQSVCFLRSPQILNAHIWVGPDNPFNLGPETEAVVGKYALDGGTAHLVMVRYQDDPTAADAETRLRAALSVIEGGPVMTIGRRGALVAAVVGEPGGDVAADLIENALGGE